MTGNKVDIQRNLKLIDTNTNTMGNKSTYLTFFDKFKYYENFEIM